MGIQSRTHPFRSLLAFILWTALPSMAQQPTQATTVPLILPGGLAYDASGNLYFAETANHVIRRVTPAGVLTTVAGNTTQGFSGDTGPATSAQLDSPAAVAIDAAGNVFVADTHNHRIRRVDAVSGIITTFAGTGTPGLSASGTAAAATNIDLPQALAFDAAQNLYFADARTHVVRRLDRAAGLVTTVAGSGRQGFSGDLGPATLAAIDSPSGIALDAQGNLYLADTHNHRVRRVDAVTGIITSVAGTGQPGFSGTALNLPRGLALDASGNLFLVDSRNERVRRIDATTGQISTIAGAGVQTFAGDGSPAVSAALDTPRAVTISPANLPTLADTANQRVRQVDSAAIIHTIAGLGATAAGVLDLTAPSVTLYGTGAITATLVASPATGSVTFFDAVGGATQTLASVPLASNSASMTTAQLPAGAHRFTATYPGDTLHSAAQSDALSMTISPAPALATPNPVALLYGQPVPTLTGTLTGILPQDSANVTLALASSAAPLSAPGGYPITAALTGSAAGNYALRETRATVAIAPAPSATTLTSGLAVHVVSSTSGVPSGTVNLLDGASLYATASLSPTGDAQFSSANLSAGTHTLTAVYAGNADFLASTSSPYLATIGTAASADFTLSATGQTSVSTVAGSPAAFSFAVNPLNGALSSPILLTATGLPTGATASFNPAYLPPANTPAAFILTIQTPKSASLTLRSTLLYALLIPAAFLVRKRRRPILLGALLALSLGCGDRINTTAAVATGATYNITVIATATSTAGATLQHTATVTLTVQP
jgi:sugar lactone lactonase YvrE